MRNLLSLVIIALVVFVVYKVITKDSSNWQHQFEQNKDKIEYNLKNKEEEQKKQEVYQPQPQPQQQQQQQPQYQYYDYGYRESKQEYYQPQQQQQQPQQQYYQPTYDQTKAEEEKRRQAEEQRKQEEYKKQEEQRRQDEQRKQQDQSYNQQKDSWYNNAAAKMSDAKVNDGVMDLLMYSVNTNNPDEFLKYIDYNNFAFVAFNNEFLLNGNDFKNNWGKNLGQYSLVKQGSMSYTTKSIKEIAQGAVLVNAELYFKYKDGYDAKGMVSAVLRYIAGRWQVLSMHISSLEVAKMS